MPHSITVEVTAILSQLISDARQIQAQGETVAEVLAHLAVSHQSLTLD